MIFRSRVRKEKKKRLNHEYKNQDPEYCCEASLLIPKHKKKRVADLQVTYHPNKRGQMRVEYQYMSGHELLSDGDYNKGSVKTFDSGDIDYEASDLDSIEGKLSVESDDVKTRDLWCQCFNNFRDNTYNKDNGFKTFPFHLCAYFYRRDNNKQCGDNNPTKKVTLQSMYWLMIICIIEQGKCYA